MSAKKTKTTRKTSTIETENKVFFMATVEAVWRENQEDPDATAAVKKRTLNILMENDSIHLCKKDLNEINRGVLQRLHQESGVAPNQVADLVLLNICILGNMTPDAFYSTETGSGQKVPH